MKKLKDKIRVRKLEGDIQILTRRGWMTWDEQRHQWSNSIGYQNFPLPESIDTSELKNMSLSEVIELVRDGDDGGVYKQVVK